MNQSRLERVVALSLIIFFGFTSHATTTILPTTPDNCDRYLDPAKYDSVIRRGYQFEQVIGTIKSHTIGIDNSIDRVAAAVRPWFVTQAHSPTISQTFPYCA